MPYLEGSGLGDLQLWEIHQQLRRKHPQDRIEWPAGLVQRSPRLQLSDARNVLKVRARNAGCGADRFRNEYLIRLVRGEMAGSVRNQALEAWGNFAGHVSNADFPSWFYTVRTTIVQFAPAPVKSFGAIPAHQDVRPVGCGGARAPACACGTQGSPGAWRCFHTPNPSEKRLTWTSRPTSLSPSLMHDSSARA